MQETLIFLGRQLHQHMIKHSFIQILWSITEVMNVNLIPSFPSSYVVSIVILELSTDEQKVNYTSLSWPLTSQGK